MLLKHKIDMFENGQNVYNLETNKLGVIIEKINNDTYDVEYFYDNSPETFIESSKENELSISDNELVKFCSENLDFKEKTDFDNGLLIFYFNLEEFGFEKNENGYIDDFNMFGCGSYTMNKVSFLYDIFTKALLPFIVIETNKGKIKRHLSQEEIENVEIYLDYFCNNNFDTSLVDKAVELTKDSKPYI